jgi:hypothetical protein
MSYLDKPGEWETRRISIIGVAKSFISQLSVGQDLTKISLPAVFQYPYSALELGGHRSTSFCHLLYQANNEEDPLKRMLCAVRWFLSSTQKEKFEKKPYNPILGEWHFTWAESEQWGRTCYLGEQTEHHPPICSFCMRNTEADVTVEGFVQVDITFHGNSVTVGTKGPMKVDMGKRKEKYTFSCMLPNVGVKNVILGTKRIAWEGEATITCEETGYKATMFFKEEGWYCTNVVNGTIVKMDKPDEPLLTFYGALGTKIMSTNPKTNAQEVLFDYEVEKRLVLNYPPLSVVDERNSLKLWHDVNKAIEVDDMSTADTLKRGVEEAQRTRRKEGNNFAPRFFKFNTETSTWDCMIDEMQAHCNKVLDSIANPPAAKPETPVEQVEKQVSNLTLAAGEGQEYAPEEL